MDNSYAGCTYFHDMGYEAYNNGEIDCPLPRCEGVSPARYRWWRGWLDARAHALCPHVDWEN